MILGGQLPGKVGSRWGKKYTVQFVRCIFLPQHRDNFPKVAAPPHERVRSHDVSGLVAPQATNSTSKCTKSKQNIRLSLLSVLKYTKYFFALPPRQTNFWITFGEHLLILSVTCQNCRRSEPPLRSEFMRVPVWGGSEAWLKWERKNSEAGVCLLNSKRSIA